MSAVTVLQCPTVSRTDPARLDRIYEVLGPEKGEQAICRTLGNLAVQVNALQALRATDDYPQMIAHARRIASLARGIGLLEVAEAARHVRTCAAQTEDIALEAVLGRLERGFDVAIGQVWDSRARG